MKKTAVQKRQAACLAAFLRKSFPDSSCSPSVCKHADQREIARGIRPEAVAQFRYTGSRKEDAGILAAAAGVVKREFRVYTREERVAETVKAFGRISFPKVLVA